MARTTRPTGEAGERTAAGDRPAVLVVSDFTGNLSKVDRHVTPLAAVADVTNVCVNAPDDCPELRFVTVPATGVRPLDLLVMFVAVCVEALRGDYDAVASFSLLPHGCFALVAGRLAGAPVHLGIIGIDLDVHATARYGPAVRWLMRRFDVVSVPGSVSARELRGHGVPDERVVRLVNPLPEDGYVSPASDRETRYDLLWVGRLAPEKAPLRFVEAVAALEARGRSVSAVVVGDGALREAVADAVERHGVADSVDLAGWVDDPREFYERSRLCLLTSERDALPLTLLEAMASGVVPVVTPVGNVPDVVDDGENGRVVREGTPEAFADVVGALLDDSETYDRMARAAPAVRDRYSTAALVEDWADVLRAMEVSTPEPER
jgi:glycosyltransferase involved in cell wall biosynthesis